MFLKMLRSKIHRAVVTQADIDYVGSITIDPDLFEAVGILPHEEVLVADLNNGARFETYVIPGPKGSGVICINGAAAKLVEVGDRIIIMAFAYATPEEAKKLRPSIVLVDEKNRIAKRLQGFSQ
jgi:aspartate 1-decarboxylase